MEAKSDERIYVFENNPSTRSLRNKRPTNFKDVSLNIIESTSPEVKQKTRKRVAVFEVTQLHPQDAEAEQEGQQADDANREASTLKLQGVQDNDYFASAVAEAIGEAEPTPPSPTVVTPRRRGRPRRNAISTQTQQSINLPLLKQIKEDSLVAPLITPITDMAELVRREEELERSWLEQKQKDMEECFGFNNDTSQRSMSGLANGQNCPDDSEYNSSEDCNICIVQPAVLPSPSKNLRHTNQLRFMFSVVNNLILNKLSWPFTKPVDAVKLKVPEYHSLIRTPMDLSTIKRRLSNFYYSSAAECLDDFYIMFRNCYQYNDYNTDVFLGAKKFQLLFLNKIAKMPKNEIEITVKKKGKKGKGSRASAVSSTVSQNLHSISFIEAIKQENSNMTEKVNTVPAQVATPVSQKLSLKIKNGMDKKTEDANLPNWVKFSIEDSESCHSRQDAFIEISQRSQNPLRKEMHPERNSPPVNMPNSEQLNREIKNQSGFNVIPKIVNIATVKKQGLEICKAYIKYICQQQINQNIIDYIIKGQHSPDVVEEKNFQNLIGGLKPNIPMMSQLCVRTIITDKVQSLKQKMKNIFVDLTHIATTADAWTVYNKSYIGITAHWLDPETLDRRSSVLACRNIFGNHTYDEVTRVLDEVNEEFGIKNKVVQVTTDNGFNFAKSRRIFRFETKEDVDELEIIEHDFKFVELTRILDRETEETNLYNIPPHERCIVHTMYLLATLDTQKAEAVGGYREILREAMARAQLLWKMQTLNLKNAEFVKEKLSELLTEPKNNLWTSQFEALKNLQQIIKEKPESLNEVCDALEVPRFRDTDKIFIDEYCKVMKPVAAAIDELRSEKNAFLGVLLPVLHTLSRRLVHFQEQAKNQSVLTHCYPLLQAIIDGIERRFSSHMFRRDLVLAAALHPEFQLTWLKDAEKEAVAAECLKEAVREVSIEIENSPAEAAEEDDEFFDFKKPAAGRNNGELWQNEVEQYLKHSTGQIKCLHSYPLIKDLFIQYNTGLPSSAASEKTFCIISDLFSHKNGYLADLCCEDMLLLKTGIR